MVCARTKISPNMAREDWDSIDSNPYDGIYIGQRYSDLKGPGVGVTCKARSGRNGEVPSLDSCWARVRTNTNSQWIVVGTTRCNDDTS